MARVHTFLVLAAAAAVSGCGDNGADDRATDWRPLVGEPTAAQTRQQEVGDDARMALASTLLGELTKALANGPPVDAIGFCKDHAPAFAQSTAEQHGVRIGRTSHRLRNPDNTAPSWAQRAVAAAGPATPAAFVGPEGELGLLQPILLMPQCSQCHGQPDELAAGVADALQQLYPDDRATGFAPGELRGWFWVEVPE